MRSRDRAGVSGHAFGSGRQDGDRPVETESFSSTIRSLRGESGVTVTQLAPMVPEYRVAMGPFPARLRIGLDIDPSGGIVPEVVLDIAVAEAADRWAIISAWAAAQEAARVEHGLPQRLPAPDLTFPEGARASVEIAYRSTLDGFDAATALTMLHIGAAFASFMARELIPQLSPQSVAELASHGIKAGRPVPFPDRLLASDIDHGAIAWVA